ncbi:uncharacterized protein SPPG_05308 [Spizellomyces punctatus DAOM BR117]|uniref:NEDD8-activating enzyme E1 regulatory subunit n=1 Tax=Spizellomyces punctatus (strain DAOM BR117) TaxID=645134 RepID=A0A0L0HFY1_SPIPD|nr:uncharacterized protein SPPG_05308 [Spizellomyces punctatus DAOM BR117]KNC99936.1 hypothetical protein SPPG_05308 [Spizellomyces punctatus DAOM BR117]|eukprot:XP_016607976.1 hypothetical protein SPPG_05308 [Spizellomyces punctatus DAOM BR117]
MIDRRTQKYDRQLRLWHAHGQSALENANVCLLNGSAVGTEILKNLILPAIGSFTVVDGKAVEVADLGNNFFLTQECLGQSRAKCVTQLLNELNEEVEGKFLEEDPTVLIEANPSYFQQYSLIIASQLPTSSLLRLADICWETNIPLVIVRTYGLFGYARIAVREHHIVETHPDQIVDLRLDCPFPVLRDMVQGYDISQLDSMAYGHIPYIILLLMCLEEWKSVHDGKLPLTSTERSQFKDLIRSKQREDVGENQNFEEALAAAYRAWTPTKIPSHIQDILQDSAADNITEHTPTFWVIARAVRDFVTNEGGGYLPLAGTVPDMHADTESYVKLQTIYRTKAREDCAAVKERVKSILVSSGRSQDAVSEEEIERFCKNAAYLKVIRYRSLKEEYEQCTLTGKKIGNWLSDPDDNIVFYVLVRAADLFYERMQRYPGAGIENVDEDISPMRQCVSELLAQWDRPDAAVSDDLILEIVRAGASELHTIAALQGGIVSQEIIKLLTRQYVPLNNTVVFNGIKSGASVYAL